MIYTDSGVFALMTDHTTYMFKVTEEGLLEHLHYGRHVGTEPASDADSARALTEKVSHPKGNVLNYRKGSQTMVEDMLLEQSSVGKGDYREPFVVIEYADGSNTSDFVYESYELSTEVQPIRGLPSAIPAGDPDVRVLKVVLREAAKPVRMELIYTVYPHSDVITRRTAIVNEGSEPIRIRRIMSTQLDLDNNGYKMITFNGHWTREMMKYETRLEQGILVNRSIAGVTSSRCNSFVMLTDEDANETYGEGYGFHLVYSGDHYESAGVSGFYKTRFVSGIEPTGFCWTLEEGGEFDSPEAIMTYTDRGYRGISEHMHSFIRKHIVRGKHKDALRPILLNSWEACYFDINELKLVNLARKAAETGIELFVVDDGWFRGRNDDTTSLGDWVPDRKKLPHGIRHLSDRIHSMGIKFGIWVEPEMISEDSEIYRKHPEYAMAVPGREAAPGRNQLLMDLTNPEVVEYIKASLRKVFSSGVDYVKWDFNRLFGDVYSRVLPADRQGETAHRWIMGLYDILSAVTTEFPDILFEGCASGGCRFDPGVLCYFPQIWASDDTDPIMRTRIQEGYSYGYPMSTVTAHVSGCPNHQTLRNTPMETRFNVALFGNLGYEFNLCESSRQELDAIKDQVSIYKEWRDILQRGDFYRAGEHEWMCVAPDRKRAVCMIWNELTEPNTYYRRVRMTGLDDDRLYHVYNIRMKHDVRRFGDLINMVSPVHIRKGSMLQNVIAHFVKMDGEQEDYTVPGELLNNSGIKLSQAFGGCGYNDQTRLFQDFDSRIFYIEAVENEKDSCDL